MKQWLSNLRYVLRVLRSHPLTRDHVVQAAGRYLKWQLGSRLVPGSVVVPWVDSCHLVLKSGMWGATMNHYAGLQDFELMSLVVHLLRTEDTFLDVGANVGVYTLLASGVAGATTVAVEPGAVAADALLAHLRVNGLGNRVALHRVAIGASDGKVRFTRGLDTLNCIVAGSSTNQDSVEIPMRSIDSMISGAPPRLLKLDVEGYETPALEGAERTITNPALLGMIIEFEGHGERYGFDETALHAQVVERGFVPHTYEPFTRSLKETSESQSASGNVLYLSRARLEETRSRVKSAKQFQVLGHSI